MYIAGMKNEMINDLGLDRQWIKGQTIKVKNCWHFTTDGNAVDCIFQNGRDYADGMNRIYVILRKYDIVILAFVLMDNHVHFILYGSFDECNRFVHEYIRRTSMSISFNHSETHKLRNVPIHHQEIGDDRYLKSAICYTVKNPTVAGLPFAPADYPWSSGPLYFRPPGLWSSPAWSSAGNEGKVKIDRELRRKELKTNELVKGEIRMEDGLIFPGEYVAVSTVERLFRTCKGYNYFLWSSKASDIEERGGAVSYLSVPDHEMRQYRQEVCMEMFGTRSARELDMPRRIRLAKALKSRYNSSSKQIARICGIKYEEVKAIL